MAQQQPNLSANTPQNFIPLQPATPSTAQDIEQAGLMEYRLRSASGWSHNNIHDDNYLSDLATILIYFIYFIFYRFTWECNRR